MGVKGRYQDIAVHGQLAPPNAVPTCHGNCYILHNFILHYCIISLKGLNKIMGYFKYVIC